MSGGSWDYFCYKLTEVAEQLQQDKDALRRAFGDHLVKCADAMHAIEWVDSGDFGRDDDREPIAAALGDNARALELEVVKRDARKLIEQMTELLKKDE